MALVKTILFVDGENLTLRYQAMLAEGYKPHDHIVHIPDVFVWSNNIATALTPEIDTDVFRINYYTSVVGTYERIEEIRANIARCKYEQAGNYYGESQITPHVFKKPVQRAKSRKVDINIAVDVMRHAYTDDADVIYVFSGDGDFLDLFRDVMRRGKRLCVGAFSSGLHPEIRHSVDRYIQLDWAFFELNMERVMIGNKSVAKLSREYEDRKRREAEEEVAARPNEQPPAA
jgi:uncharacterized LabA/DUF88 family protein